MPLLLYNALSTIQEGSIDPKALGAIDWKAQFNDEGRDTDHRGGKALKHLLSKKETN